MRRPEWIARQASHPRGLVGCMLARIMASETGLGLNWDWGQVLNYDFTDFWQARVDGKTVNSRPDSFYWG